MSRPTVIGKAEIDRSATALLEFLKENRTTRLFRFPFSGSFPVNSCESTSLILKYLLDEKYSLSDTLIIKGSKPCGYEHHFWVVAGGLTYDLTAHQFDGHEPIIGGLGHTLHLDEFTEWSTKVEWDFVDRNEVITFYRAGVIPF